MKDLIDLIYLYEPMNEQNGWKSVSIFEF